ncbi:hypothetical protein SAMN05428941_6870 [Streptomyces sp. 2114.2]|nr:hypothetical protein BX268_6884 [Streptomyces sp. 2221.1]SDT79912.1 hypothetical protein SAMN05428941_6870 [Streptomyces sp. 2114.2]
MAAPAQKASSAARDGRADFAPFPALTSTTAARASGRPISPQVLPLHQPDTDRQYRRN